jgi:ribose transport system substrate-binding protein
MNLPERGGRPKPKRDGGSRMKRTVGAMLLATMGVVVGLTACSSTSKEQTASSVATQPGVVTTATAEPSATGSSTPVAPSTESASTEPTEPTTTAAGSESRGALLAAGTAVAPPVSGPKAQPDKKVWVISCGDYDESCKQGADGFMEAGEALAYSMTRFDSAGDAAKVAEGIRTAITDKADAVIVAAFDCTLLKGPLQEAKDAKLVTYGAGTSNCDDPLLGDGEEGLYTLTDVLAPGTGVGWSSWVNTWGADKAAYVIDKTDAKAKVINLTLTDLPNVELISKSFQDAIAACSGCEVVADVPFTIAEAVSGGLSQSLTNALNTHPDANVIHFPVDGLLPLLGPAIIEAGRSDSVFVIGGEGFPANLDSIRTSGAQDSVLAVDLTWESWSTLDDLNRYFAGEKPVYGGWGYTAVSSDLNLPASGPWISKFDYKAAYRKVWAG